MQFLLTASLALSAAAAPIVAPIAVGTVELSTVDSTVDGLDSQLTGTVGSVESELTSTVGGVAKRLLGLSTDGVVAEVDGLAAEGEGELTPVTSEVSSLGLTNLAKRLLGLNTDGVVADANGVIVDADGTLASATSEVNGLGLTGLAKRLLGLSTDGVVSEVDGVVVEGESELSPVTSTAESEVASLGLGLPVRDVDVALDTDNLVPALSTDSAMTEANSLVSEVEGEVPSLAAPSVAVPAVAVSARDVDVAINTDNLVPALSTNSAMTEANSVVSEVEGEVPSLAVPAISVPAVAVSARDVDVALNTDNLVPALSTDSAMTEANSVVSEVEGEVPSLAVPSVAVPAVAVSGKRAIAIDAEGIVADVNTDGLVATVGSL